ncbi:protocadherin-10-like [Stegostoma tigrinum]|uniref:protocadherin-10-like n=1 Tax=Stegostoma tigrinum TaxID=3053191 RepID=UPI00286FC704|nr:protocadherin-10-like [Stegostoma tigrinum]
MANTRKGGMSFICLLCVLDLVRGQIRYMIPEELERGAFVGKITEDLKREAWELSVHKCRLVTSERKKYIEVNLEDGILFVNERIDREQICRQSSTCSLSFEIALDNPLEMHRVVVEILDVNDNSPQFSKAEFSLQISELIAPGARFPLESAHDPDVGTNAISTYQISPNDHFYIKVQIRSDGSRSAELILDKSLDREQQSTFHLTLTAFDGGIPPRSGTARLTIMVVDINDNAPLFDREIYKSTLAENSAKGTLVATISAVDLDEGTNAEVTYSFTHHVSERIRELFTLEPNNGEIRVEGVLDFEETTVYELDVQAVDSAVPGLAGHAKVMVHLLDLNDNFPVIDVTSVSSTVSEDTAPGTVIAVVTVTDLDSEQNGQVHCQVLRDGPFKLQKSSRNKFELLTRNILDRETVSFYNISLSAWDEGTPTLSAHRTILIELSDINDNAPRFTQSSYNAYLMENNAPGASIFAVTAFDSDSDKNGDVAYSISENRMQKGPGYVTINSKNGNIYSLRSFDYERLKHFQIQVEAQDAGSPSRSSTATVNVIILDQNDNAPVITSPLMWNSSALLEIKSQVVHPGSLVSKIIATDADSGQNARLSYQVLEGTDSRIFTVGHLSGEIRATQNIREHEIVAERLIILVKDNGQPSLSSTATISFIIGANVTDKSSEPSDKPRLSEYFSVPNRYLIIILGSTSFLFLVAIIVLVILKFRQDGSIAETCNSSELCHRSSSWNGSSYHRPSPNERLNYAGPVQNEGYHYTICLSPESSKSDFLFLKPYHPTMPFKEANVRGANVMN